MSVSSGKLFARACIPPGMDLALEGLAREVLKEQPRDIYLFAARHFQRLVQIRDQEKSGDKSNEGGKATEKAHSAGLSPSSTQASENAGLIPDTPTEGEKPVAEEVVITSQDAVREISLDTNGAAKTGVGLGPGVAALAASTGTVAILGATADTTLDTVEGVKQVAEGVVNDVKVAAEEAVKDGKKVVEDVGTEAVGLVGKTVDGLFKSPSPDDKLSSELKEAASIPTSPVQEDSLLQSSLRSSPVVEDIKSPDVKEASVPTSPILEAQAQSKEGSGVSSPSAPVESKEASAVTSPIPEIIKEIGEIKEEATLSLSSLPEDSIPSSIKEDVPPASSPSATEENEESLTKSPSVDREINDAVNIAAEVQGKATSRPASGVKVDLDEKKETGIMDESFPAPPPPEIQETAATTVKQEVDATLGAIKRSIDQDVEELNKHAPAQVAEGILPVSVAAFETKIEDIKDTVGGVKAATLAQISSTVDSVRGEVSPASVEDAVVEQAVGKVSSALSQNPHIEVSAPSRPQSSDVGLFAATSPEVSEKQEFAASTQNADIKAEAELENPQAQETKQDSAETDAARPTSAQVEEKAEEVVNEVVQTVTEMVTTAATTIQATFRGHQTRQNLRKIADQEELTDAAISSELDKDADVTLSLDAKSSDTKEESSETVEDSFPPPLNDGDSELLSTSTEKEELQPVVNVTISAEPAESRASSVVESEKATEEKTLPSESEHGSLEGLVEDLPRAASVVSESTVSIGDSISAVKGSETDSTASANEEQGGDSEGKKGAAATTIQASFRGFQARQNLQKIVDDTQLPVPEPLQDLPFEDVADEDDLPPPPEECDIEPPPPVTEEVVETPRSPETGEKLKKPAAQVSAEPPSSEEQHVIAEVVADIADKAEKSAEIATFNAAGLHEEISAAGKAAVKSVENGTYSASGLHEEILAAGKTAVKSVEDGTFSVAGLHEEIVAAGKVETHDDEMSQEDAAKLALLQRPQQCDELPEHRGEVAVDLQSADTVPEPEPKGDLVNGVLNADASSAEVDDSSLSSAATKIQAGARGYLTRKLMKDTFSTTAPSITDSQSVGATLTSDDGFHTSGSLETEVQRQTSTDEQNIGVTAVVIANIADKAAKSAENSTFNAAGLHEEILAAGETVVKSVENGTYSASGLHEEILSAGKGRSLDSQLPQEKKKPVLATASSEGKATDAVEDKQVWQTLQGEMEEAATKIQSNFRGYRTRQRLHRENAVQVTTSSGTPGTTSESSDAPPPPPATPATAEATTIRSSGEFHDMMVLAPDPPAPADVTSDSGDGVSVGVGGGVGVEDDALAARQASELGTRLEGHVIAVATPAPDAVSAMGKARETTSPKESSTKEMKGSVAKAAATKIQAGFRGYKVRKQMKQMQEKKNGPRRRSSVQPTQIVRDKVTLQDKSATTIQAGVRGFLVRKRRLEEKNAAVKIQAGFRGYKVRRDVKTRAPPVEK